ncbi:hypothetical protein KQI65_00185 [bacterium]|nr:hypothetical protein [bacterium]
MSTDRDHIASGATARRTFGFNASAKKWFAPAILLLVLLAFYLPNVLSHAEFYTDDYYLLTLLRERGIPSPFSGTAGPYHAAMRPLAMLSLGLDYLLFDTHSGWYYVSNLLMVWLASLALYMLMRRLIVQFSPYGDSILPLLFASAFILHADMFYAAVWISNRTEVLMILLYLLGVLTMLQYFSTGRRMQLLAVYLLFVLMLATKAQPAHFPLLFLFVGYLLHRTDRTPLRVRSIFSASVPLFLLTAAYAWVTILHDPRLSSLPFQWLPEKMMSAIGISLIAFHPTLAEPVYTYFVYHKAAAMVVAVLLVALAVWLLQRFSSLQRRTLLGFALLYAISLYPRILHFSAPRVNSIQVVLILLFLCWFALQLPRRYGMALAGVFLGLHLAATAAVELPRFYDQVSNHRYRQLLADEQGHPEQYRLMVSRQYFDSYAMYFHRHHAFGKDSTFVKFPVLVDLQYGSRTGFQYDIFRRGDTLVFASADPRTTFFQESTFTLPEDFTIGWEQEVKPGNYLRVCLLQRVPVDGARYLVERDYRYERMDDYLRFAQTEPVR